MRASVIVSLTIALPTIVLQSAFGAISIGFNSSEGYSLGPLSPSISTAQNGWSGGAQGGFTNNDPGDEQIVNTVVHSGDQSWHYARGYNSPGQGTAYSPNDSSAVTNIGDSMSGSVWFKVHTPGDGSLLAVETGNIAGDDRAEILFYVDNLNTGLNVRTFEYGGGAFPTTNVATGLDPSIWHELTFALTRSSGGNDLSLSVDGGAAQSFDGSLADFRTANSFPYSESSRLKFRPRHTDGDLSFNGFYLDDINYSVSAAAVPEATSLIVWALLTMTVGGATLWRRQRVAC